MYRLHMRIFTAVVYITVWRKVDLQKRKSERDNVKVIMGNDAFALD